MTFNALGFIIIYILRKSKWGKRRETYGMVMFRVIRL